jgi:vacuolar-type H+-ATPase subunit H
MEKDVLSQVIEAEKEIQKCLEAEKVKVREWIEAFKKESEADLLGEERKIREALDQSLADAAQQAQAKAGDIVNDAGKSAARLGQLSPETLRRIVEQRLTKILPG